MTEKIKTFAEMNKREKFSVIREVVSANEEYAAFLTHEIELLENKATSPKKPTATQVENEGFKADIVAFLEGADAPKSIKEIQAGVPSVATLSNQRITHILTALVKSEVITKDYVKKVPFYFINK